MRDHSRHTDDGDAIRGIVITVLAIVMALALATGVSGLGASSANETAQSGATITPPQGGPGGRGGPGGPGRPGGFGEMGGPGGLGPALFELDLTAEQLAQMKSIREEARASSEPYQALVRRLNDELGALVRSESFDESAVRELAVSEAKATAELRVIGARTEAAVYRLLTPDQRTKLKQVDRRPRQPGR